MDGESSYESDISESWSLIDFNLNEELLSPAEASTFLSKTPPESKHSFNIDKSDDLELENFLKECKKSNETDFREVSDSDSDSDSSFKNDGVATCTKKELNPRDTEKNDSGDTESIEILDLDGHQDSETDKLDISFIKQLDFATYQSDDEDSLEEGVNRTNNSTVIKRKKQRLNRNSENSVNSVNSEIKPVKNNLKTSEENPLDEESHSTTSNPVYKHYRNNVANTFLSLSVGVIFAGVACLAIGHFLGVQNAAETAVELAETSKKLQMENAALQSRLFHLSKALLSQEMNSKEQPENQSHPKELICEKPPQTLSQTSETDLNTAALSEILSSLKSVEWLAKIKNILQTNHKGEIDPENGINLNEFANYIHDQLHSLKKRHEERTKLFEDTERKMSRVLQKIINRLLSSHDSIEILYQRLIKLKNKLNANSDTKFRDMKIQSEKKQEKFPVTERDLQTIKWNPENKIRENSGLFKFPQPEKYYELKSNLTFKSENKIKKKYKQKKDKKHGKKEKKDKRFVKKDSRAAFNETKKYQKLESKDLKLNLRLKKYKKPKKVLLSKLQKVFYKKHGKTYSEPQYFNRTGYWVFKWADGRKESRRHHSLSDWQFDRAKARKGVRDLDRLNWQFERAKARKELRDDDLKENWQIKRASARESTRAQDRWPRGKQMRYNGKEFFHERFSWF